MEGGILPKNKLTNNFEFIENKQTRIGWFKNGSLSLHGYGLEIKIYKEKQTSQEGLYETKGYEDSLHIKKRDDVELYDGYSDFIAQEIDWNEYFINKVDMDSHRKSYVFDQDQNESNLS